VSDVFGAFIKWNVSGSSEIPKASIDGRKKMLS
jgi:hypothetical protein